MSTHNIGVYKDLTKIIFELSSNTHLIDNEVISSRSGSSQTGPCQAHLRIKST